MRLEISGEADEDLRFIYDVGATRFGVDAADRYAARLVQALSLIRDYPRIARLRTGLAGEVRAFPVMSHVVVYKIVDDTVLIVRVRHGREDWLTDTL